MSVLTISQVPASNPPVFMVQVGRVSSPAPIAVTSPSEVTVPGRPNTSLRTDLRWYLEAFLQYPYPPLTEEAARIVDTLRAWGRKAFEDLFYSGKARDAYVAHANPGLETLTLEIESDDPAVLAWPWEALEDAERGILGHQCAVIRRLRQAADPPPLLNYPQDAVNVLLITCRPYDNDVQYGAIARPLVELVHDRQLPARVTVLRPPTIEALTEHLAENRGRYHIVHFDGHGGFGHDGAQRGDQFRGPMGKLVFEDEEGKAHAIDADRLTNLLREHRIPIVVLNACQSAMTDGAEDPFASVAAALIKAGVRSVVAMAYSLYVTGAQEFLPAFYTTLFRTGSVREAVRGGRQRMLQHPNRGLHDLQDWVVPVLYEHAETYALTFAASADAPTEAAELPEGAEQGESPHGLVGRDETLLRLERALRGNPPAIVLHAMAGMGKTTLATGFLQWLGQTDGMDGAVWIRFDLGFRTAEYVLGRMLKQLTGTPPGPEPFEAKLKFLRQGLRNARSVIVWDNFEVVAGIPENPHSATFTPEERTRLRQIVSALRGTQAKILITSRRDEPWLDLDRIPIPLPKLNEEDRQILAARILTDLGIPVPKDDAAFGELLKALDGHPLSMRVVLPRLLATRPESVLQEFTRELTTTGASNEAESHLLAALRLVETSIPEPLRPLLLPLRFCDRWVIPGLLKRIALEAKSGHTESDINRFCSSLVYAGLAERRGDWLEVLPTVSTFVELVVWPSEASLTTDRWLGASISAYALFCESIIRDKSERTLRLLIGFRSSLTPLLHSARDRNFHVWLRLVQSISLAHYLLRMLPEAFDLYSDSIAACKSEGVEDWVGVLTHQLGMVEQARGNRTAAEKYFRQSININRRHGNSRAVAESTGQLGTLAHLRNQNGDAKSFYLDALGIFNDNKDETQAAVVMHQLGVVAQACDELHDAEAWYRQSLQSSLDRNDEVQAAQTLHQLGLLAEQNKDYDEAEQLYCRSIEIDVRRGNDSQAAMSLHQLGMVAQLQGNVTKAESLYKHALELEERCGDEGAKASTLHQLGTIAQAQGRFAEAEGWYIRSLELKERFRNWSGIVNSCGQLGVLSLARNDWVQSSMWFVRGLSIALEFSAPIAKTLSRHFLNSVQAAPKSEHPAMWKIWTDAGLPLPDVENP